VRIAITGASGFVGRAIASRARLAGCEVLALARRDPQLPEVEFRRWDITAPPSPEVRRIGQSQDVAAVVHAAAAVDDWVAAATARRVNIGGTANVLAAFPHARFVHISSSSVYPPQGPSVQIAEDAVRPPLTERIKYFNNYAATKAGAEAVVRGAVQNKPQCQAIVLRPHAIYGPGDRTLLPRVEAAVRRGQLWLPAGGAVAQNLTHVDTIAHAALVAATRNWDAIMGPEDEQQEPVVINVADRAPVIVADALGEVLKRRGIDVQIRALPVAVAHGAAWILEEAARITGRKSAPVLTRYLVSQLGYERTYCLKRLRARLGITPEVTSFRGSENW